MKFLILIAVCTIGAAFSNPVFREMTKGQPGCKTDEELEVGMYAYLDDPQFYWECAQKDVDAECRYCPIGTLFQADLRICVDVDIYEWTPKIDPPSWPEDYLGFCTVPKKPTNGQPGCKTLEEVQKRYHPNPDDITRYWECLGLNQIAICQKCPDDTVFELDRCVKAGTEIWFKSEPPRSTPDILINCYEPNLISK